MLPVSEKCRFYDLNPPRADFRSDVCSGLSRPQKSLPCKYFYDERGSALFDEICNLPEYYPTRTEMGILSRHASEMAEAVGEGSVLIEYGAGSGQKVRYLLDRLRPAVYMPVDISREQLLTSIHAISEAYPGMEVEGVCADYTRLGHSPALERYDGLRRSIFFPGSTIGNFTPEETVGFLSEAARLVGAGGGLLVGVDLQKDPKILEAAYNDARGVTAAFNLNVLSRINRELGGGFDLNSFRHRARYNGEENRIEMHLVSRQEQTVPIGELQFHFREGETIHTECSYKYTVEGFIALARRAGFASRHVWQDGDCLFSVHYLVAEL